MKSLVCILFFVATTQAHSCMSCDRNRCREPQNCRGGIVLDVCGCCHVCARQQNQSCGGLFGTEGRCDVGLKCVIHPENGNSLESEMETGICKLISDASSSETCKEVPFQGCNVVDNDCRCSTERACTNPFQHESQLQCDLYLLSIEKSKKDCSDFRCSLRYTPNCPADSELIDSVWPAGECCPLPSKCKCRKSGCRQIVCQKGYDRVLVQRAAGRPGSCCDFYQCKPKRNECNDVTCPPIDFNVTCPDDSVKITHRKSKDGCCELSPKCRCKSSNCPETKCSEGYRAIISVRGTGRPGTCCEIIQCVRETPKGSCSVNGTIYTHGEEFKRSPCLQCRCLNGVDHCSREQCEILACTRQYIPEGECCPKCKLIVLGPPTTIRPIRICTDDFGETHLPGDSWFPDPCTRCVCRANGAKCIASSCQKNCENPRPVEGKCCGICDEPTYRTIPSSMSCPSMAKCNLTGAECPFGFKSDDLGCRLCECRQKSEVCQSIASCKLNCSRGYVVNGVGCETCHCKRSKTCRDMSACDKKCPLGFRKDKYGCSRCRCRRCDDVIASCHKNCKYGRVVNKYGCEICKCRSSGDLEPDPPVHSRSCNDETKRDDGEGWTTASGRQCVCRYGTILCDMVECPVPHCDHPVPAKGSVCAICPDSAPFTSDQLTCGTRVEGETWDPDECTSCVCNAGRVMCTYEECKPAPCAKPIYKEGHCCPTCPAYQPEGISESGVACISKDGTPRRPGSIWREDKCTSCKCENGEKRCFGEKCPQVHNCLNPVIKRDQCCPQCLDDGEEMNACHIGDRDFTHGEVWSMKSDSCASCTCVHGNIFCRKEVCPPLPENCDSVIKPQNECCYRCLVVDPGPQEQESDMIVVPILAGVGGFLALLLILGIIAFFIHKSKSKGPKMQYAKGHIVKKKPGVAT